MFVDTIHRITKLAQEKQIKSFVEKERMFDSQKIKNIGLLNTFSLEYSIKWLYEIIEWSAQDGESYCEFYMFQKQYLKDIMNKLKQDGFNCYYVEYDEKEKYYYSNDKVIIPAHTSIFVNW